MGYSVIKTILPQNNSLYNNTWMEVKKQFFLKNKHLIMMLVCSWMLLNQKLFLQQVIAKLFIITTSLFTVSDKKYLRRGLALCETDRPSANTSLLPAIVWC